LSNEEKTNDYEKGMIYMNILKKREVVEKRGGGGNEIHAPCAGGFHSKIIRPARTLIFYNSSESNPIRVFTSIHYYCLRLYIHCLQYHQGKKPNSKTSYNKSFYCHL
jgi:hypothetical protein